jgi:hypothetical protein
MSSPGALNYGGQSPGAVQFNFSGPTPPPDEPVFFSGVTEISFDSIGSGSTVANVFGVSGIEFDTSGEGQTSSLVSAITGIEFDLSGSFTVLADDIVYFSGVTEIAFDGSGCGETDSSFAGVVDALEFSSLADGQSISVTAGETGIEFDLTGNIYIVDDSGVVFFSGVTELSFDAAGIIDVKSFVAGETGIEFKTFSKRTPSSEIPKRARLVVIPKQSRFVLIQKQNRYILIRR